MAEEGTKLTLIILEVEDPQAAMAFGKREDTAKIRTEGGLDVESSKLIFIISETHNWS